MISPRSSETGDRRTGWEDWAMASTMSSPKKAVGGESHRVYWQQWLSTNETSTGSRREWITSSVAVRMAPEARAVDVTNLLRDSLGLGEKDDANNNNNSLKDDSSGGGDDALILVGTLYSLSSDFVQYQHEVEEQQRHQQQQPFKPPRLEEAAAAATTLGRARSAPVTASATTSGSSGVSASRSDPVHLVHTLNPSDSPLRVRERMVQRVQALEQEAVQANGGKGRHIMATQIQWYFIPALRVSSTESSSSSTTPPNSSIPNCLHLEGYCTSMEEEENDDDDDKEWTYADYDDDDEEKGETSTELEASFQTEQERMEARFPWLASPGGGAAETSGIPSAAATANRDARKKQRVLRKLAKERKWSTELAEAQQRSLAGHPQAQQQQQAGPHHSTNKNKPQLTGFLLKRCNRDRHVWRKVHCVLTHDYLWFLTRLYTVRCRSATTEAQEEEECFRYCHVGRLRLTRALLLQPTADYAPLYRTPYAFELVTADGTWHAFRATQKHWQQQWIRVLSERIVQSYENSLLQQAQLLLVDECVARSKRLEAVVNAPGLHQQQQQQQATTRRSKDKFQIRASCLWRWGMQVAEYRELGRHVQSILPAKSPVVAAGRRPSPSTAASTIAALSLAATATPPPPPPPPAPLDPAVRAWIRKVWVQARQLWTLLSAGPPLEQQVRIVRPQDDDEEEEEQDDDEEPFCYPRRIETLFHHIEYVISGRRHGATSNDAVAETDHQNMPPPLDLFDPLLAELYTLVARGDEENDKVEEKTQ